ncbi:MAG TPA: tRNA epoxyqueuosine(34) reductase QueG [Verrucomicrobiota bacterium]|nr:tRNA epoxyqueuosine(34) reductase QueG [Verrucomicrobiota bacterium]HRZ36380.1 tRNA epoxyqueuosine(34) reductase QueG [Candidatus Paceibacterota bacterium]HRZ54199.1 tRNA epoxyqueuosine(34) reductase QueG [Candidatus Paceibacterota bacterium]
MKVALRQRARQLGFDACRVTGADPPPYAPRFKAWLEAGRHGTMAYLVRTAPQRADPRILLPGARSVVTLAASYWQAPDPPPAQPPSQLRGFVARYARYADYHGVLVQRIEQLAAFIATLDDPAPRSMGCIDAGPVLERDLAQRAGIGFVGKHTNLVSRQLGNWFFLAEILTTLELEPDPPQANRCGSCARCLEACPTRALIAPFEVDARLCIAYLTIELKGPIPVELRPAVGNRIFGCDDCLSVCPWNRFAQAGCLMRKHARPDLAEPDLLELLRLDDSEFRCRFADTPLARTKRRGLLRNVCVALGNIGTAVALPALECAARDPEPLIAEHASWALTRIQQRQTPRLFTRQSDFAR